MCAVLSHVQLFVTPWSVARQAPLSMGILQVGILEWVAIPSSRLNPWVGKIPWRRKWSSSLAWKIPWTEEPDRLQTMGSQRVGHD